MAFQPRLLSTVPGRPPDVDIIFHGQLLLRSRDGVNCEVGVNPLALNHQLSIWSVTKVPGQPDVVNMRHNGPLNFRGVEGMTIGVTGEIDTRAAWKCVSNDAVDPVQGGGAPPQDFRWILNLEGSLFHNSLLQCPLFGTQNSIKLTNGEYFFRTGVRSGSNLKYVRRRAAANPTDFRRIGAVARASVFLNQTQSLVMTWRDATAEQTLALGKPPTNGIHEIYVENTPLFIPETSAIGHDELVEYYKVLPGVNQADRFTLHSERENPGPFDKGTPTIPCQVIRLDEPGGG